MAGFIPAIHVLAQAKKAWMPGSSPGMTIIIFTVIARSESIPPPSFRGAQREPGIHQAADRED